MGPPLPGGGRKRATSPLPWRWCATTRGASEGVTSARSWCRPPGGSPSAPGGGCARPIGDVLALRRPSGTCIQRASAPAAGTRACGCCLSAWPWSCGRSGAGGKPQSWPSPTLGLGNCGRHRCGLLACCCGGSGKSLTSIDAAEMSLCIGTSTRGRRRLASFSTTETIVVLDEHSVERLTCAQMWAQEVG